MLSYFNWVLRIYELLLLSNVCFGLCYSKDVEHIKIPYEDVSYRCDYPLFQDLFEFAEDTRNQSLTIRGNAEILDFSKALDFERRKFQRFEHDNIFCQIDLSSMDTKKEFTRLVSFQLDEKFAVEGLVIPKHRMVTKDNWAISQFRILCRYEDMEESSWKCPMTIESYVELMNNFYRTTWAQNYFGPKAVANAVAANVVYVNLHQHIWKTSTPIKRPKKKVDIMMLHAESCSYEDLQIRMPRLKKLLEHDDFVIFHHQNVLGYNTMYHLEGLNRGTRLSEYAEMQPTFGVGAGPVDYQLDFHLHKDLEAEGYVTLTLSDAAELDMYLTNRRSIIDYNGINEMKMQLSAWTNVPPGYRASEICDFVRPGKMPENRKTLEEAHLNLHQPVYSYTFVDGLQGSHDGWNSTNAQEFVIGLLTGKARNVLLENTFIAVFGDHGRRMNHPFATTEDYTDVEHSHPAGVQQERTHPFMALRVPDRLYRRHPHLQEQLRWNNKTLTTIYDVRETILDIIWNRFELDVGVYRINTLKSFPEFTLTKKNVQGMLHVSNLYVNKKYGSHLVIPERFADVNKEKTCARKITGKELVNWRYSKSMFLQRKGGRSDLRRSHLASSSSRYSYVASPEETDYYVDMDTDGPIYHSQGDGGISLFKKLSDKRDCLDAAAPPEFCTCYFEPPRQLFTIVQVPLINDVMRKNNRPGQALAFSPFHNTAAKLFKDARLETKEILIKEGMSKTCVDAVYRALYQMTQDVEKRGNLGFYGNKGCAHGFQEGNQVLMNLSYIGMSGHGEFVFTTEFITEYALHWGYTFSLGPSDLVCFGKSELQANYDRPAIVTLHGFAGRLDYYSGTVDCIESFHGSTFHFDVSQQYCYCPCVDHPCEPGEIPECP